MVTTRSLQGIAGDFCHGKSLVVVYIIRHKIVVSYGLTQFNVQYKIC